MKLLDLTLISVLAATSRVAPAQTAEAPAPESAGAERPAVDCSDTSCQGDDGLLLQLRTRSYDQPLTKGTSDRSSSESLQPDRRATIEASRPGKASARGKFSISLPTGGVIWATEDPDLGQPVLSVSASSLVAIEGGRITRPIDFHVRGNYGAFVDRYEISIYRASDGDLIDPIATVPVKGGAVARAEWNGEPPPKVPLREGDELVYVLRAYDSEGRFDETHPRTLQLVNPVEVDGAIRQLRDRAERRYGIAMSADEAAERSLLDDLFFENGLRQQNIPIHGSRIRIQGRNVSDGLSLTINGESYPIDAQRKFVAEYLVPVGQHKFDIGLQGAAGAKDVSHHTLDIDVSGRYFFGVAQANVTVAQNDVSGSDATLAVDNRYRDDVISDARLAFYGKAKLGGKYLVTAHADTTERELEHLFDDFAKAYPYDVFRRLDPDLYYPTYGDDSTTYRDADTMGRLYLRVDWDKNQALWGNYATGFTGNDYAQYVRSLYGAALSLRSRGINPWGDPKTELRAFGSEAQTAPGHNEFIGTGGSLYYLKHTDLLPGSVAVVLEVRDLTTGRVENRIPLRQGTDYEVDELQGRILLSRPLAQVTRDNISTLTRDAPLDGFEQRLVVDYEWVPSGFDDDIAAGVRAKQWLGDHVGVGVTYVEENKAGQDYTLAGGDLTLQAGKGTYVKLEYAQTEAIGAPVFFSDNGGLSFTQFNDTATYVEGDARSIEARANLRELGWSQSDMTVGAWHREIGAGFAASRYARGRAVTETGAELLGNLGPRLGAYARYSEAESGTDGLRQAQGTLEWRIDDDNTLSAELRRVQERTAGFEATGLLGALKYARRVNPSLDLYGLVQTTLDDGDGRYADNDAVVLGAKYLLGKKASLGTELSSGDRGDSATLNADYRVSDVQTVYGGYTYSTDTTQHASLFNPNRQNGWTLGQRWRLSNQVNLFNESQFLKEPNQSGLAHTFGLDFFPAQGWNLGTTVQVAELDAATGLVERRAASISGGRTSPDTEWQSKLEWRRDTGAEAREQWVSTNRLTHKVSESLRLSGRLNYADTDDRLHPQGGAKLIESNLGFAYRPHNSQRWALLGRYTYLYDLATLDQEFGAQVDQRSQILSLEGIYKRDQHWEFAARLARREGDVRFERGAGPWFDSAATFAAVQVRYELRSQWHALTEFRSLSVDAQGGARRGFLVGIDRDINKHFRIGAGYNFTDFSDDLTDFDYDHRGWFLTLVGSY